jgi:hypothetical protein
MDKNTIMDIEFPYTQQLIASAKLPYLNHTTAYAVPIMILCGLTSIPKTIQNPIITNLLSVFIMLIGAILLVMLNKKQIDLLFSDMAQPTDKTIAKVTMDETAIHYNIKNDFNTLTSTYCFGIEITDVVTNKKTTGILSNKNQYMVIPTASIPDPKIIQTLRTKIQKQNFGSKELYTFLSITLALLTLLNIAGWIA